MWLPEVGQARGLPLLAQDLRHGHLARSWTSPFLVSLAQQERAALERWHCATPIQAGLAKRAKLLLLRAENHLLSAVAQRIELGRRIVRTYT